jgi:methionyl-tRNA formyltransferase
MGTPDFAVPILQTLLTDHDVVCVYSQPPRPAGRGHRVTKSPVQRLAEQYNIEVRTPRKLKAAEEHARFRDLAADVAIVAAYGLILPAAVLEAPTMGCINVHASLLPRWRGAAPIQRAILAGDSQSGVCLMKMDEGLDTGAVYCCRSTPVDDRTSAGDLHDRLAQLGSNLIGDCLPKVARGEIVAEPQPAEGITYAAKIERGETKIVWQNSAADVVRQINAFSPSPGAWTSLGGDRVKILVATMTDGRGEPGQAITDDLVVACRDGALRVDRLQLAGRQALSASDFLIGRPVLAGTMFT